MKKLKHLVPNCHLSNFGPGENSDTTLGGAGGDGDVDDSTGR
jgi:hypothetical protein